MNKVDIQQERVAVSVAKYDRSRRRVVPQVGNGGPKTWAPKRPTDSTNGGRSRAGAVSAGRSYLDALNNTNLEKKSISFVGEGLLYPRHCMGKSVIGDVKDIHAFPSLKKAILGWGFPESSLFYVGGGDEMQDYIPFFRSCRSICGRGEMERVLRFYGSLAWG
ncbi:hypothetical protein L1987_84922 [Smallanthus sonchifolius]|uniref:Uncharacterized protein n=1 Tax=Smallanthus sonchifolius TaxID=185202 RepID=A0ACB8XVQ5_9ASTR|nr:hypothetical protein L1987_84922 [Smallanthus sonchifolius]